MGACCQSAKSPVNSFSALSVVRVLTPIINLFVRCMLSICIIKAHGWLTLDMFRTKPVLNSKNSWRQLQWPTHWKQQDVTELFKGVVAVPEHVSAIVQDPPPAVTARRFPKTTRWKPSRNSRCCTRTPPSESKWNTWLLCVAKLLWLLKGIPSFGEQIVILAISHNKLQTTFYKSITSNYTLPSRTAYRKSIKSSSYSKTFSWTLSFVSLMTRVPTSWVFFSISFVNPSCRPILTTLHANCRPWDSNANSAISHSPATQLGQVKALAVGSAWCSQTSNIVGVSWKQPAPVRQPNSFLCKRGISNQ